MPIFRTSQPVSAADTGKPHLILVGLPGAGKTTVGKAVSEKLARSFLDFDVEIERREHATVAEIFGEKGEPHFRALERALTEELLEVGNMVLAPGAGWIANEGCLELLLPQSILVYLKVKPEVALKRMAADVVKRPLLARPDPLGELHRILEAREKLYLQSNHTVSTDTMSFDQVVEHILALVAAQRGY